MLDAISLSAATALAKIVLDKFFEGAGQKLEANATQLGGTAVEKAQAKIMELGRLIWQRCFKGKQGVDERLKAAAEGSEPDIKVLQAYVDKELEAGGEFAEQVQQLANELHQVVFEMKDVNAKNMQQNFDRQNTQVNAPNTNVYNVGDSSTVYFGTPPASQG